MHRKLFAFALLLLACGGPRKPGAVPDEVVYWKVDNSKSAVEFGACTDHPQFRNPIQPVTFAENSYLVLKYSSDGKKAVNQKCDSFDPASCTPNESGLTFDVAGSTELQLTNQAKEPLGDGGCNIETTDNWVGTDRGTSLDFELATTISLIDAPADCTDIENDVKAVSPNGLGYQGCVVTQKFGFTHP